jgi:CRP-like cAMP-binding protein
MSASFDVPSALEAMPVFRGIKPGALAMLAERAVPRRVGRGSILWTQGTSAKGLHLLLEGRVRAVHVRNGRETVLHRSGPGSTLGEVPLFDGGTYPATLIADTEVLVLVVDRLTLEAAMGRDVGLAWRFLHSLGTRVRELATRLESQGADSVMTRLARHLARRTAVEGPTSFRLGLTQAALARDLGTVREVVARRLGELVAAGVLRRAGRATYDLLDLAALRRLADGPRSPEG